MKKVLLWFKNPHGIQVTLHYVLTIMAIIGAILIVVLNENQSKFGVFEYTMFAIAGITLGYSVYTIVRCEPKIKQKIILWSQKNEFTNKLIKNYGFRTIVFSILSLIISVGYALFNGIIGVVFSSIWYGSLAGYYILLALMRGGALFYHRKENKHVKIENGKSLQKIREIKTYRAIGCLLIALPLALSVAILQMVTSGKAFEHFGLTIYAVAVYTFYKITMSIINFVKAKKNNDLTVQAIRNINLADAMVSILALQTAMFLAFSQDGVNVGQANAITGGVVCFLTILLGIYMLINAALKLKKCRKEER